MYTIRRFYQLKIYTMIIDGRALAERLLGELSIKIQQLDTPPQLSVILVGENAASLSYIRQKERAARIAGLEFELHRLPEATTEDELIEMIHALNQDRSVHGIIVQLPLPEKIDTNKIIDIIDPRKDVDGFTSENIGKLFLGRADLVCCTPK